MRALFIIVCSIFLSACTNPCSDEIISEITDSEQRTQVVHVRRNCGATTDYSHHIYIVAAGSSYEDKQAIFVADKVSNLSVSWLEAQTVEISYDAARIFNFKNFWQSADVDNFKYAIKVTLRESDK